MTETQAAVIPQERGTIRAELRQVEARLREEERQREELAFLPELWHVLFDGAGDDPRFLALFSGLRSALDVKLTETRTAYFAYPHETAAALRWIARETKADRRDLYMGAHLVTRWRRRREDAARLTALYADLDGAPLPQGQLAPTVAVESSPGHYHVYYRLTRPVAPGEGAALNRPLAATLNADPSGSDLSQVLRIPGTRNWKYPHAPLVRLVALNAVHYHPAELDQLLPALSRPQPPRLISYRGQLAASEPGAASETPPMPLSRPALRIWRGERPTRKAAGTVDRSASLFAIGRILAGGLRREDLITALAERDAALYGKYVDRPQEYERIADALQVSLITEIFHPADHVVFPGAWSHGGGFATPTGGARPQSESAGVPEPGRCSRASRGQAAGGGKSR